MIIAAVILVTTAALVIGAFWGSYLKLSEPVEGFLVAMAGGALIVSLMDELIRPALEDLPLAAVIGSIMAGAAVFSSADAWIVRSLRGSSGAGLMLAVTLDGIPENLALGGALLESDALGVAALAGSIFLANLPEAAGGARQMIRGGAGKGRVLMMWSAVAAVLAASALGGYFGLAAAPAGLLAAINCFAAGAVVASLSTEVFPKAFKDEAQWSGVAVAIGLALALALAQLGK